MLTRRILVLLATLGFLAGFAVPASAQQPVDPNARPAALQPLDGASVEAFWDAYMQTELDRQHIPGAVVLVVQGDSVLFAKGYGVSDLASGAPVNPAGTGFHVASVSKLFTWTAVMQLVEQGKLDLNADVNEYLDFRIPAAFGRPVTLFHLMTHTAGFQEDNFEARSATPPAPEDLGRWLKTHVPARVRAPGELTAYSNYGAGLAGYIVERVSGEPFATYIQNHVLGPLGMNASSIALPMPEQIAARMAAGYWWSGGAYRRGDPEYGSTVPAGALRTTAADMSHFMIAHLQNGRYGSARILDEMTALRMHERAFANDPRVPGNAYGFWEMSQNDVRIIGHAGDVATFHSLLALIPDAQAGLFISYNSTGGAGRQKPALSAFVDRFYPAQAAPSAPAPGGAALVAGTYHSTRSSKTTVEALLNLVSPAIVRANPDGSVTFTSAPGQPYFGSGPAVFQAAGGDDRLVFRQDAQGRVTHLFHSSDPTVAYERAAWYEEPSLHLALLGVGLLLTLSVFPAAFIGWLRRRKNPTAQPTGARVARHIMQDMAFITLIFVAGLLFVLSDQAAYTLGQVTLARIVLALPVVMLAGALAATVYAVLAWRRHYWPTFQTGHYTLSVAGLFLVLWVLNFWNAIGWRF